MEVRFLHLKKGGVYLRKIRRAKQVTTMKKQMGVGMLSINREGLLCGRNSIFVHRFQGKFKGVYRVEEKFLKAER